jgi:membrane protein insertase Oxa1/YidC/SpoIIIJ
LTVFIGFQLPGGLTLYWFLSTLFTTLQQLIIFKKKNNTLAGNIIEGKVE